MPYDANYCAIKMPKQKPEELQKRQMFQLFPTEWIPYGSPYWQDVINRMTVVRIGQRVDLQSVFDGVWCHAVKYERGRIVVTRNHTNVVVCEKGDTPSPTVTDILEDDCDRALDGRIPTDLIPKDSPYYAELVRDFFFPKNCGQWVHTYGRDGVKVEFYLGKDGESVLVQRNGTKVELYSRNNA